MRYIGNKTKIVDQINDLIDSLKLGKNNFTFFDAFSGTATVGNYFKTKFKIIANDNLYSSYVLTQAKLNTPDLKFAKLGKDPFDVFNDVTNQYKGFIYENYSPGGSAHRMYFSEENAARIDFIRLKIEEWLKKEYIDKKEYYYLIACLIESVSKVANVAGVYGAYLKKWDPRALKPMNFIPVEMKNVYSKFENEVYNKKIEELINDVSGDILYLDPPYTKNQYSVQYHLLETIARYDNPEIKGITGARDTSNLTSFFSKVGDVHVEFEKLIARANFKYIILSYSSDGIMSKEYIENVLKRHGKPETLKFKKIEYRRYLNSKAKNEEHYEYLFYIEKNNLENIVYSSPLNYIGGKADMILFLKKYFPKNIDRFVDLFGGGFNVGINCDSKQLIYNDCNFKVRELLEVFKNEDTANICRYLNKMIKKYKLEKGNKDSYLKIRDLYNQTPINKRDPKLLYLLVLYGFQQQIRFNSSYDYNNPVGQAGFNDKILEKLVSYCRNLKEKNVSFYSKNFDELDDLILRDSFVYCDPPYLITLGSYNDGKRGFNGWNELDEINLLRYLEELNSRGVKFMLSNVLEHKDKKNDLLINWIKDNNFKVIKYDGKARKNRNEVIIINYEVKRMKITFPRNNRRLNEVFNTIDEKNFNHDLLRKILCESFNEKIDSYELVFDEKLDKKGNFKSQYGQFFRVETDDVVKYILITAESCKDTRNGYIAAKMPLCIRAWFYDTTPKDKVLEIFLTDTSTVSSVNDYHTFIYRLSKTFGVKLLGEEKLPYLKFDSTSNKHVYRKKKILLDQTIETVHDIKKARDNSQKKNIGNKSSYILEAEDFIIIYAKVDANSEFEMVYLATIINFLAKKEGKQTYLYQVEELYSNSFGDDNIKFLRDQGIKVIEALQKYENNPDIELDESKTSRNQAEFYKNLLKKYNHDSDYRCCYFCGDDFQDSLIASHIQRVTDINKLDIPFMEKRKKAVDSDNGFWLCPIHDKYLENGYIYFIDDKMQIADNLTERQKEKIKKTFCMRNDVSFEIIDIVDADNFDVRINPIHYNENMHNYLEEHRKRVTEKD